MRTINNQDRIASRINELNLTGVEAVGDDGNVCVGVVGTEAHTRQVAQAILSEIGDIDTGDGVQVGCICINNDAQNIHDDLSAFLWD